MLQGRPPAAFNAPSLPSSPPVSPLLSLILSFAQKKTALRIRPTERGRGGQGQADRPTHGRGRATNPRTHGRPPLARRSECHKYLLPFRLACLLACSPAKSHFHLRTGRAARIGGHLLAKINRAACTYVGFASDVDDGKLFCVFVRLGTRQAAGGIFKVGHEQAKL